MKKLFSDQEIQGAQQRWREARTFAELCELTAEFVEGRSPYFPGYWSQTLDSESNPLTESLARFNRAGFLTIGSQPGFDGEGYDGKNWKQRAFVQGFAMPPVAGRLATVTVRSDVIVFTLSPLEEICGLSIPGTQRAGEPMLWVGRPVRPADVHLDQVCNAEAMSELKETLYVELIDPVWGREGRLWEEIERVVWIVRGKLGMPIPYSCLVTRTVTRRTDCEKRGRTYRIHTNGRSPR